MSSWILKACDFCGLESLPVRGSPLFPGLTSCPKLGSGCSLRLLRRAFHRFYLRLDFGFDRLKIEARPPLHRRVGDERLGVFADLLLQENEAPELVDVEITDVFEGPDVALLEAHPLIQIEPQIG